MNTKPNKLLYDGFLKIQSTDTDLGDREVCVRPDAVACLLHDNDHILLTVQQRVGPLYHNDHENFYEVPAGMIDPNETAVQAVIREIYEELSVKLTAPKYHGVFYPSPGGLSERIHLYSQRFVSLKSLHITPQQDKYEHIEFHILRNYEYSISDMKTQLLLKCIGL